jgi:hypothetical protein
MTSFNVLPDIETLAGTWESPALEPMPLPGGTQLFITRAFDFHDRNWRVRFCGWADAGGRSRLFDGVGEGTYALEDAWAPVAGARAAVFHFSRRLFMPHTAQLARQLTESGAGQGPWAPGIQQDVSLTGALFVPSLAQVGTEYDLVAFDEGPDGALDLYLGDRSHEMNQPGLRPTKRNAFPVRRIA